MAKKQKLVVETGIGTFTRTTARAYTHIVVCHRDINRARKYAFEYQGTDQDRKNFEYYQREANLGVEGLKAQHARKWGYEKADSEFQAEYECAVAKVEGGFEAYVERIRRHLIEGFHKSVGENGFAPFAFAWCGRLDLAQKQADIAAKRGFLGVEIFPVPQA